MGPMQQAMPRMDADILVPEALDRLLADLESPSPSIEQFKVHLARDEWGGFFGSSKFLPSKASQGGLGRVRLRVLGPLGTAPLSGPSI